MLFILYINDITEIDIEGSSVKLFADDTLIYVTGESCEELNKRLNDALRAMKKMDGFK